MLTMIAALALSTYSTGITPYDALVRPPTMNISAVRQIRCDGWTGSGFLIGDHIMVTANHVMKGGYFCKDVASGSPLYTYKTDPAHDLAIVTGPKLPTDIPYIKYSCERFKPGEVYLSYGITGYMQNHPLIRNNALLATKSVAPVGDKFHDGTIVGGARIFYGNQAPGMSGGPVADVYGYAHGVVTGGNGYISYHHDFTDGILCK